MHQCEAVMVAFPDGIVLQRRFDDFDAAASAFPGWKLETFAAGPGPCTLELQLATTRDMQLLRLRLAAPLLITGLSPSGVSGAALHLRADGGIRSRGRHIDPLATAPSRLHQSEVHYLNNGPVELVLIAVDEALFQRQLRTRVLKSAEELGADWLLRPSPGSAALRDRGLAIGGLLSALLSGAIASPEAKHRLQECALHILLDRVEADESRARSLSLRAKLRAARAAEEMLRARLDEPPSLSELCEALGVPERTLHAAFHEGFGMTPKAYLRALRLSAAHRQLRRGGGSVTDVATDLGFFHFGRFSMEYRAMFGEPPSVTLRRARGSA